MPPTVAPVCRRWGIYALLALAVRPALAQPPTPPFPLPGQASENFVLEGPPRAGSIEAEPAGFTFEPAETAARIGDQYIFRGDLLGDVNLLMEGLLLAYPPASRESLRSQFENQRPRLMDQQLASAIERKLLYIEFLRSVPADKLQEALAKINQRVADTFEEELFKTLDELHELPEEEYQELAQQKARLFRLAYLMKEQNLTSMGQLEALLRSKGSSLAKQRQAFAERVLGQQILRDKIDVNPEITHQEMQQYYDEHKEEFRVPPRARWEQITIRFSRCRDKREAGEMIAAIGNELVLGGAPFHAVAKRSSHGAQAEKGGFHDWTEWGDLEISREINEQVFGIELNKLSRIITDSEGCHIIRVLDREDAHVIPFTAAQIEIEKKLKNRKRGESITDYLAGLRERTPIWQE